MFAPQKWSSPRRGPFFPRVTKQLTIRIHVPECPAEPAGLEVSDKLRILSDARFFFPLFLFLFLFLFLSPSLSANRQTKTRVFEGEGSLVDGWRNGARGRADGPVSALQDRSETAPYRRRDRGGLHICGGAEFDAQGHVFFLLLFLGSGIFQLCSAPCI